MREMLEDLLGNDASMDGLAQSIYARTGGNPFVTEEVVQSLIESGALEGARGSYRLVKPIERLQAPTTVQALLAARIDRLAEREKFVLQSAAVIGKDFSEPILRRVVNEISHLPLSETELGLALRVLKDGDFILGQSLYPVPEAAVTRHSLCYFLGRAGLRRDIRAPDADYYRALQSSEVISLATTPSSTKLSANSF